jgi:ankyrin repeat protein
MRELLRLKAQVDLTDPDGTTPLVLALMNGHWDAGKLLIEAGADVNLWDLYGQSPLYMAVDMKTLPAGARVELPAMDALGGVDMIKLLLAKGANPNMQLKLRPPYRQAVFDRNADFALVAGSTPLLRAAVAADVETMQLLLAAGARVDLPNEEGVTPFMATVSASGTRGKLKTEEQANEALKLLQAAGADVGEPVVLRRVRHVQRQRVQRVLADGLRLEHKAHERKHCQAACAHAVGGA